MSSSLVEETKQMRMCRNPLIAKSSQDRGVDEIGLLAKSNISNSKESNIAPNQPSNNQAKATNDLSSDKTCESCFLSTNLDV